MNNTDASTWILGLDLGDRSRGAVCCANWLAGPEHTTAIHVMEMWTRPHVRTDAISTVQEVVRRLAREMHVPPPAHVSVIDAETAEEGLVRASEGAAGLVIGRAAGRREDTAWSLGRVARRVLRRLPCPVVVVPRDLSAIAPGPVLLATDLDVSSLAAVGFARELAMKHGRELLVVHVGETRYSDLVDDLDPGWRRARGAYCEELELGVHQWMTQHALIGRPRIVYGSVVDELETLAIATQAAIVVVGSRRLGTAGRIFLGSTASALAGHAACPVAVVASI